MVCNTAISIIAGSATAGASFIPTLISVPSSNGNHKTGTLQDNHYVPKIAGVGNKVSVIWNGLDGDGRALRLYPPIHQQRRQLR